MSQMSKKPRRGGRQKGTPNKIPAALKEMICTALEAEGGVGYLRRQARENPTAFLSLIGKLIPAEVNAKHCGLTYEQLLEQQLAGHSGMVP